MAFHTELDLEEMDGLACSRRPWGLLTTTTVAYWGLLTTRATTTFNSCRKIHDLNNTQQTQKQLCYINHFPNSCRLIWRLRKSRSILWENVKKIVKCLLTFFFGVLDVEPRLVETLKKACPATTFCYLRWKLTNWDFFPSQPGGQGVRIRHWGTKDGKEVTMEKVQKGNILLLGGWIWIELKCLITWHCGV